MKFRQAFIFFFAVFFLTACNKMQVIISGIPEKEANLIIVFLESKGIPAQKNQMVATGAAAATSTGTQYSIMVPEKQAISAISILNRNGLPRKHGTTLLELFAKSGLMTSDKEETIRYQAGLAEQISNTILMMDGVIDASVQLSFPQEETTPGIENKEKISAAVYVKHQGILDDPHSHLETKIKRLVAGSITGLDVNDVVVVSDRSRLTEATPGEVAESMESSSGGEKGYVRIWSIVMSKESAAKFKVIFFFCLFFALIFAALFGWMLWKVYPTLRKRGLKNMLSPEPLEFSKAPPQKTQEPEPPPEEV